MADITLNEIRLRRSFDPGYRPGMAGSEALKPGEPFVNFADNVLCLGTLNGAFVELPLFSEGFGGTLASRGYATIEGALPSTDVPIYGTPAGPVTGEKFAGSPFQFYSVGGYVPGPHCYAQNIFAMRTRRDHTAQEQGLAIQMINDTGKPPAGASSGDINNGKSAFTIATRVEAGGGNSWGAAIAQDIGPNVGTGFFATIEFDTNNFNASSQPGSGPQIVGIFSNTYSTFKKLAMFWATGFVPTPESPRAQRYWHYGLFFQSPNLIEEAVVQIDCPARRGIMFGAVDVGVCFDTSLANTATALKVKEGQAIQFGDSYDLYVANARLYVRRRSDLTNIASVDANGTIRALGPILGSTTP